MSPCSADSISSDEEEMRTMGSSGSESSTPDKMATAASIFTEQSNLVSKCKRFEQKYRLALEQKVSVFVIFICCHVFSEDKCIELDVISHIGNICNVFIPPL